MSNHIDISSLPISIQLHTLREEMAKDPIETLRRVARIGFKFVEPASLFNISPREFRKTVEDLGMQIGSSHSPWAGHQEIAKTIDVAGELGLKQVVGGYMQDGFADLDAIKSTADKVNELQESLAQAGFELFLHNHWWEFAPIEGRLAIDHLLDLCPTIKLELDLYWAAHFGDQDVPALMRRLKDRIVLLHVKDGDFSPIQGAPLLALGDGKMDLPACLAETDADRVGYYVFEMDRCATDYWEATEKSFRYLETLAGSSVEEATR